MGRSGGCQKYKAPKNIQRYKRNMWGKLHPAPHIPFTIPVHSSAGFCVLWFLTVIFSTLLAGLPLGCWTATPHLHPSHHHSRTEMARGPGGLCDPRVALHQ